MQKSQATNSVGGSLLSHMEKEKEYFHFLGELKKEVKRVSWTEKKDLVVATKTVVFSIIILGGTIYGFDLLLRGMMMFLQYVANYIFG